MLLSIDQLSAIGSLEVVCGSMYAGKSEALIRLIRRARYAGKRVTIFKPTIDTRTSVDKVHTHNGNNIAATPIETNRPEDILQQDLSKIDVIGIDEVQFFDLKIIDVIQQLISMGKQVIVVGLDLDFRGKPFGAMPYLLAIADTITKLQAVCLKCGGNAYVSQRLVNGKPAKADDPLIVIGAQEAYEARCRTCYQAPEKTNAL